MFPVSKILCVWRQGRTLLSQSQVTRKGTWGMPCHQHEANCIPKGSFSVIACPKWPSPAQRQVEDSRWKKGGVNDWPGETLSVCTMSWWWWCFLGNCKSIVFWVLAGCHAYPGDVRSDSGTLCNPVSVGKQVPGHMQLGWGQLMTHRLCSLTGQCPCLVLWIQGRMPSKQDVLSQVFIHKRPLIILQSY